jgi:hypothetical protein
MGGPLFPYAHVLVRDRSVSWPIQARDFCELNSLVSEWRILAPRRQRRWEGGGRVCDRPRGQSHIPIDEWARVSSTHEPIGIHMDMRMRGRRGRGWRATFPRESHLSPEEPVRPLLTLQQTSVRTSRTSFSSIAAFTAYAFSDRRVFFGPFRGTGESVEHRRLCPHDPSVMSRWDIRHIAMPE